MFGFHNQHPMIIFGELPNHGMTAHTSGTSLSAQARYAAGVREILECFFEKKPIREPYLIVKDGQLAGMGAHSYSKGSATGGSKKQLNTKNKPIMIVGSVKEDTSLDKRISITPETSKNLIDLGLKVYLESKYAEHLGISEMKKYSNVKFLTDRRRVNSKCRFVKLK